MRFVSKQGQPQPHVLSKARAPSPQLKNGLLTIIFLHYHKNALASCKGIQGSLRF